MRADCAYAKRTAADAMTIEDYLALPHIAPSPFLRGYQGLVEAYLERQGLQRNVMVASAYFNLIPYMLTQTDLVLTTGTQFLRFYEKTLPLKSFVSPIKFPPIRYYQLWHERVHQATEHKWLRDLVSAATQSLVAG